MSDSPVVKPVVGGITDVAKGVAGAIRGAVNSVGTSIGLIDEPPIKGRSGAQQATIDEAARRRGIVTLGQNLASKGTQEISGIDFSQLALPYHAGTNASGTSLAGDQSAADVLNARKDTILSKRLAPGRTQTLLSSRLRST